VRPVAVHLEDELGAAGERVPEAGEIRRAEPLLLRAVEHVDERQLGGEPIGKLAGTVRRAVVDHDHAVARLQHALELP
jgi:hypothetical protein